MVSLYPRLTPRIDIGKLKKRETRLCAMFIEGEGNASPKKRLMSSRRESNRGKSGDSFPWLRRRRTLSFLKVSAHRAARSNQAEKKEGKAGERRGKPEIRNGWGRPFAPAGENDWTKKKRFAPKEWPWTENTVREESLSFILPMTISSKVAHVVRREKKVENRPPRKGRFSIVENEEKQTSKGRR